MQTALPFSQIHGQFYSYRPSVAAQGELKGQGFSILALGCQQQLASLQDRLEALQLYNFFPVFRMEGSIPSYSQSQPSEK